MRRICEETANSNPSAPGVGAASAEVDRDYERDVTMVPARSKIYGSGRAGTEPGADVDSRVSCHAASHSWPLALLVLLAAVGFLAGCRQAPYSSSPTPSQSTSSSPISNPPSSTSRTANPPTVSSSTPAPTTNAATISVVQPITGSVQITPDVTISVQVTGLRLVDKAGQANVQGEGHIIYYLDVEAPTVQGQPALTAPGTYVATASASYQWSDLPDAVHTLSVELVNNDNTPLNPPVTAKVSISVFTG